MSQPTQIEIPIHLRQLFLQAPCRSQPYPCPVGANSQSHELESDLDSSWTLVKKKQRSSSRKLPSENGEIQHIRNRLITRYVPRFTPNANEGYWENLPASSDIDQVEEMEDKGWHQFEKEQKRRSRLLADWMAGNGYTAHTRTHCMSF